MSAPSKMLRPRRTAARCCRDSASTPVSGPSRTTRSQVPPWVYATFATTATATRNLQPPLSSSRPLSTSSQPPSRQAESYPPNLTTISAKSQKTGKLPKESRQKFLPQVFWFNNSPDLTLFSQPERPDPEEAERKVKLGKTLRTLQTHLPTLLQSPPPQAILSPSISLHLFPSTHPHLPTVRGRVAYIAALWSSPIAWNRLPLVGNVRLEILSERMVQPPFGPSTTQRPESACGERLIVRWRTAPSSSANGSKSSSAKTTTPQISPTPIDDGPSGNGGGIGGSKSARPPVGSSLPAGSGSEKSKEFTGLFIFDFDREGRILSHTIEHVQEGGQWEKGVGAKVVGLTDWLLGGIKRGGEEPCPAFMALREKHRWR